MLIWGGNAPQTEAKMNYITEIKAFYDRLELFPLEATHISLWHGLMSIANRTGWREEFSVPMSTLEFKTGIKRTNLYKVRNKLKQAGLIDFKEREGKQSSVYKMLPLCSPHERNSDISVTDERQTSDTPVSDEANINKQNKTKQNKNNSPLNPPEGENAEKNNSENREEKKKIKKDELNQIFVDGSSSFTNELKQAVKNWIAYKIERGEDYKPTGLKSLLSEIKNNAQKYGDGEVVEVINQSMAANYTGITFGKLGNSYNSNFNKTQQAHPPEQQPHPCALQANRELTPEEWAEFERLEKSQSETPLEKKLREAREKFNVQHQQNV